MQLIVSDTRSSLCLCNLEQQDCALYEKSKIKEIIHRQQNKTKHQLADYAVCPYNEGYNNDAADSDDNLRTAELEGTLWNIESSPYSGGTAGN